MYPAHVLDAVKRRACMIAPVATWSYRARPGKIGSPAASALVHPAGRTASERRSQTAPEPACHLPLTFFAANNS